MSVRPSHILVCRLSHALSYVQPTLWRRAQAGLYGLVTRDARGRQQVELAAVERAEGIVFTEAQIARMVDKPATNVVQQRQRRERLQRLFPPPMHIVVLDTAIYSAADVRGLIAGYLAKRDASWTVSLNAVLNRTTPQFHK